VLLRVNGILNFTCSQYFLIAEKSGFESPDFSFMTSQQADVFDFGNKTKWTILNRFLNYKHIHMQTLLFAC